MTDKKSSIMQKVQRFGGAMFTPVLLSLIHIFLTSFLSIVLNMIVSFCLAENICLPVDNQGQALCFAPLTIPMQKDLGQTSRI